MTTLVLPALRSFNSFLDDLFSGKINLLERLAMDLHRAGAHEPFGL